jgi:hypothetical protein
MKNTGATEIIDICVDVRQTTPTTTFQLNQDQCLRKRLITLAFALLSGHNLDGPSDI